MTVRHDNPTKQPVQFPRDALLGLADRPAMEQAGWRRRLWVIAFALFAMLLLWQIITRSLEAYLANAAPETAIGLRPDDPIALLNLADSRLALNYSVRSANSASNTSSTPLITSGKPPAGPSVPSPHAENMPETERIRAWAELAFRHDPLNARAARILGLLADRDADGPRASKLMLAAARRSMNESAAVYWLMLKSYKHKDYAPAIYYADVLLRTRPQVITYVMPVLTRMAENKDTSDKIKKLLASNPPWRGVFFANLPGSVSDARTPLALFLSINDTPTPPTVEELRVYFNFLISHKLYELAHSAWLQLLQPFQSHKADLLFNGSFETIPSGLPFDWVIAPGAGVTADIVVRPGQEDQHALFIEFGYGRVEFRPITQLILLAPGTYKFEGRYEGEVVGRRGLQWRVTCAGAATTPIGQSPMIAGLAREWRAFDFTFTVPDNNCSAQYVSLILDARSASEQLVSGAIWFDDVQISHAPRNDDSR